MSDSKPNQADQKPELKKLLETEVGQLHSGFALNVRQPSTVPLLMKQVFLTINALVDEVADLKKQIAELKTPPAKSPPATPTPPAKPASNPSKPPETI